MLSVIIKVPIHLKVKVYLSVAVPPMCQTYLWLRAYFVILHVRVRKILRMNAHENFTCANVNNRTENAGENSKITFFNWMTLTFDFDHQTHLRGYQGQSLCQIL